MQPLSMPVRPFLLHSLLCQQAVSFLFLLYPADVSALEALPEPERLAGALRFTLAEQEGSALRSISSDSKLTPIPSPTAFAPRSMGVVSTNTPSLAAPTKLAQRILQLE